MESRLTIAVTLAALVFFAGCFSPTTSSSTTTIIPDDPVAPKAPPKPEPPPVVQGPPADAKPVPITFEDLDIGMQPDVVFEDWMLTLRVKAKMNQRVRITGFLCGAIFQSKNISEIPLLREKECPYGPGGQAHHVIQVRMRPTDLLDFTTEPVTLEGNLSLKPFTGPNGRTWSLYQLDDAIRVKP